MVDFAISDLLASVNFIPYSFVCSFCIEGTERVTGGHFPLNGESVVR